MSEQATTVEGKKKTKKVVKKVVRKTATPVVEVTA